jgi:WD40 repeat protein
VSGSGDKTARVWDMASDSGNFRVLSIDEPELDAGVTSVAISPDGRLVAAGSLDTAVRLWDVQTGALVEKLRSHKDSVYSVAFTPDGKGLVSGSLDKTLKYWDIRGIMARAAARKELGSKEPVPPGPPSACTMNFLGHKVRRQWILSGLFSDVLIWCSTGLRSQCRCLCRRPVGRLRLEGPWCTVLGRAQRDSAAHAPGPQELGHLD